MQVLRRRFTLGAGLALVIVAVLSLVAPADHAVKEITLPLRHDDIIRQQAADKKVDAALIAGSSTPSRASATRPRTPAPRA